MISILRGTDFTKRCVFGKYSGKFNLLQKSEISDAIAELERHGVIRSRYVQGEYRNYSIYSVTTDGNCSLSCRTALFRGKDRSRSRSIRSL